MCKVLNKRVHGIPHGAVYVGRPSVYGNPFVIGTHGTRDEVVDRYEQALLKKFERDPHALERLQNALRGKDLVCWCAPARCHADVLLKYANQEAGNPIGGEGKCMTHS